MRPENVLKAWRGVDEGLKTEKEQEAGQLEKTGDSQGHINGPN